MIVLDPDLEPDSPRGRRPVHGASSAGRAPRSHSATRKAAAKPSGPRKDIGIPSARTLAGFLSKAQQAVRLKGQVTVLLTTDAAIAKLNHQFRGKNKATDVLSFPAQGLGAEGIAGDIAISVTTAMGQAEEQGHSLWMEIKVLILHGLLHLAGYDHETDDGKMARRERLLRGRLGLPQGLIERASVSAEPTAAVSHPGRKSAARMGHPPSSARQKARTLPSTKAKRP